MQYKKEKFSKILEKTKKHYPELKNTNIKIKQRKSKYVMHTRPCLDPVFYLKNKQKRKYYIIITKGKNRKFLNTLSKKELKGWIGHELAHILEYEKMSNLNLLKFTIKYFTNSNFRKNAETKADTETIKHNLKEELKQGVEKTLNSNMLSKKYKKRMKKYYLSIKELGKIEKINN